MKIPKSLHKYFWDVDIKKIDTKSRAYFIINRLLDKGDVLAVKWIKKTYPQKTIANTFTTMRGYQPKVASFWSLLLKIPQEKVICLQEPYLERRRTHWPY